MDSEDLKEIPGKMRNRMAVITKQGHELKLHTDARNSLAHYSQGVLARARK